MSCKHLGEALDISEKITKSNNANVLDYYNYANLLPKESKLAKEYREKATKLSIGITNSMDVNNKNLPHEYYLKNLSVNSSKGDHGLIFIDNDIKNKVLFLSEQPSVGNFKTGSKKVKSKYPIYNFYEGNFNSETFFIELTKSKLKNFAPNFRGVWGL